MIKAKIYVTLKPSVLDPQGAVICNTLHTLGYAGITDTRVSKYFEMNFTENDTEKVNTQVNQICDKLLANPNTEVYTYSLEVV